MGETKHGTAIEWTHQPGFKGETWNPVTGCTKVSPGCKNCYAERIHNIRHLAHMRGKRMPAQYSEPFHVINLHDNRLEAPLHWKKPRMVFVNSMSDLFHEDVPAMFISQVFDVMRDTPRHTYQVLTKRGKRLAAIGDAIRWPANVWMGVSVEDVVWSARIANLRATPARIKFLSCEPLLGRLRDLNLEGIDWVIVGGETGPGARSMDPDWARDIRDQCKASGVAFFMKQMSRKAPMPDDLMIREYPDA